MFSCRRIDIAILIFSGLSLFTTQVSAQEKTGLKIGEKAPAFQLKDQNGQGRKLSDLLKEGNVALVFYRSASW